MQLSFGELAAIAGAPAGATLAERTRGLAQLYVAVETAIDRSIAAATL